MKTEHQGVSFPIAKRLKELKVKQAGALFYWLQYGEIDQVHADRSFEKCENAYAAFTVAELGEMLPEDFILPGRHCYGDSICNRFDLKIEKEANRWNVYYSNGEEHSGWVSADTEADARGKMLIYLLENNLIKP